MARQRTDATARSDPNDDNGGDTTETDSERECDGVSAKCALKRELKREARVAVAAEEPQTATATAPSAQEDAGTALPPGIAPNSILAVMLSTPAVPDPVSSVAAVEGTETDAPEPETSQVANPGESAAPPSQHEYCALCAEKFKTRAKKPRTVKADDMSCACCRRTWLKATDFSHTQRSRADSERRCRICTQGDPEILDILRGLSRVTREELIAKNVQVILEKRQATEKRRATLAKRKLERAQQEDEEEQELAARAQDRGSTSAEQVIVIEEDPSSSSDGEETTHRMEKEVRDIITAIRSVHRRSQVIDLDGPDREAYEMQLLDEEAKLHEQAATLCLHNPAVYDQVCEKLLVIDGKVKLGERDHEQGDFDGEKPNHRVTKTGKTRVIRKKPDSGAIERAEALLRGAKATAERRRQTQDVIEPPRKRVRRVDENGIELAVLNRPRRRVAKPVSYVIE